MSDEGEGLRASSSLSSSSSSSPASAGQTPLSQPPGPLKRRASAPHPRTDRPHTRSRDASPRSPLESIARRSPARPGRCSGASPVRDGLQNRGQRPDHETRRPEEVIETPHSCAPPHAWVKPSLRDFITSYNTWEEFRNGQMENVCQVTYCFIWSIFQLTAGFFPQVKTFNMTESTCLYFREVFSLL